MMATPALKDVGNNLDLFCASHAQSIAKQVMKGFGAEKPAENLITRTLGVLQEHGIYATFLWLFTRSEKEKNAAKEMVGGLQTLITSMDENYLPDMQRFLEQPATNPMLINLPTLLLVKRTMERALTYARYHAKAEIEKEKAKTADATPQAGDNHAE